MGSLFAFSFHLAHVLRLLPLLLAPGLASAHCEEGAHLDCSNVAKRIAAQQTCEKYWHVQAVHEAMSMHASSGMVVKWKQLLKLGNIIVV